MPGELGIHAPRPNLTSPDAPSGIPPEAPGCPDLLTPWRAASLVVLFVLLTGSSLLAVRPVPATDFTAPKTTIAGKKHASPAYDLTSPARPPARAPTAPARAPTASARAPTTSPANPDVSCDPGSGIRIICIVLDSRREFMRRQLDALKSSAPCKFNVTYLPAVTTIDDPRVVGWAKRESFESAGTGGGKTYLALLSHTVAAGLVAEESDARWSVITEDDILLHKDFGAVGDFLRRSSSIDRSVIQLGYIVQNRAPIRALGDLLQQNSLAFCIRVSLFGKFDVAASKGRGRLCVNGPTDRTTFSLGRSSDAYPWGLQAYALTREHASYLWGSRRSLLDPEESMENNIFPRTHPYRMVPPAVITSDAFESSLDHNQVNARSKAALSRLVNFFDYMHCATAVNATIFSGKCAPTEYSTWETRAVGMGRTSGVQIFLAAFPRLCLAVSSTHAPANPASISLQVRLSVLVYSFVCLHASVLTLCVDMLFWWS